MEGEGLEEGERGRNLNRPLSSACADTFPATVGFFDFSRSREKAKKGKARGGAAKLLTSFDVFAIEKKGQREAVRRSGCPSPPPRGGASPQGEAENKARICNRSLSARIHLPQRD